MLSFHFVCNKQSIRKKIQSVSTTLSLNFFPDTASLFHPNNLLHYLVIKHYSFITSTLFIPSIMMK